MIYSALLPTAFCNEIKFKESQQNLLSLRTSPTYNKLKLTKKKKNTHKFMSSSYILKQKKYFKVKKIVKHHVIIYNDLNLQS